MKNPFKRNIKKNKNMMITYIDIEKELETLKKNANAWIMANIQSIAIYLELMKSPININHIPAVAHLFQLHQSKINRIAVIVDRNLSQLRTLYNKHEKGFGSNSPYKETDTQAVINSLESEQKDLLCKASDGHAKDMADEERIIAKMEKVVKEQEDKHKNLPHHNLRPRKIGVGILIGFLIFAELLMSKDAFEYASFYPPASTLIGLGIAIGAYAVSGIGLVRIWKSSLNLIYKLLASALIAGIAVITYYTIGTIKTSQMASEVNDGLFNLSPEHFLILNLLLFAGMFCAKFFLYPSKKLLEENEVFDLSAKKLKKTQKNLKEHKERYFNGYKVEDQKRDKIKKGFNKKINPLKTAQNNEVKAYRQVAVDFNKELAEARNYYAQINANFKSSVALLFNTVPQYNDGKAILLDIGALENLDNPFANITLLATPNNAKHIEVQGFKTTQ